MPMSVKVEIKLWLELDNDNCLGLYAEGPGTPRTELGKLPHGSRSNRDLKDLVRDTVDGIYDALAAAFDTPIVGGAT